MAKTTSDPSTWLTTEQTAARIGRSPSLIPSLVADGKLVPVFEGPHRRNGRVQHRMFDPETVAAYLANRDHTED